MSPKEEVLLSYGYAVNVRDPRVKPDFAGQFMLTDIEDTSDGSYAVVGDDREELVQDAYAWMGLDDLD